MRKETIRSLSFAWVAAALAGCPSLPDVYDEPYEVIGPLEVSGKLVWSLAPARSLIVLDPASREAAPVRRLPFEPRDLAVADDRVVAVGIAEDGPRVATTTVDDPAAAVESVALPGVFDRALPAPGGRYAILTFDPNRDPEPGVPAVRNANEIAVVDFEAGQATRVTLGTESLAPRDVVIDPEGALAAVVLDSAVVVLELADPAARVTVPLVLDGGTRLYPAEAKFSSDGRHLFLRASGTADVISLALERTDSGLSGSINFLFAAGAEALRDLVVPSGEGFEGYVAAVFSRPAGGGTIAALLDADGDRSRGREVELDVTVTRLVDLGQGRLLLFDASPNAVGTAQLVGWAPLEDRIDEDQLAGAALEPPAVAGPVAFFRHRGAAGQEGLTAVSIRAEATRDRVTQRPLVLSGVPGDVAADPATGTVLLGVDVAREGSGAAPDYDGDFTSDTGALVLLSESDDRIDTVVLDEVITRVGAVGGHYYAVHPDPFGDVTFLPKADPSRQAAFRRDGFLLGGVLDVPDVEVSP